MKKHAGLFLIIVMLVFASVLIGFFLGRNVNSSPIQITKLPEPTSGTNVTRPADKINVNTADVETLQKIPGIGAVLAQRIVDFRTENGPFQTISELTRVNGIGLEKLNQMMDYITV